MIIKCSCKDGEYEFILSSKIASRIEYIKTFKEYCKYENYYLFDFREFCKSTVKDSFEFIYDCYDGFPGFLELKHIKFIDYIQVDEFIWKILLKRLLTKAKTIESFDEIIQEISSLKNINLDFYEELKEFRFGKNKFEIHGNKIQMEKNTPCIIRVADWQDEKFYIKNIVLSDDYFMIYPIPDRFVEILDIPLKEPEKICNFILESLQLFEKKTKIILFEEKALKIGIDSETIQAYKQKIKE